MARLLVIALSISTAVGCYSSRPADRARAETAPAATCPPPTPAPEARWRHSWDSAMSSTLLGQAHHAASDPVVNPGSDALVHGKFVYGATSKDLEDEDVSLWLRQRDCGWQPVVTARTDDVGRARFVVPAAAIQKPGVYPFQLVVHGDRTRAYGNIFVVRRGTPVVVFDLDGTLTTSDAQLAKQLLLGDDPTMRPDADRVVRAWSDAGYLPIYITGRPYFLRESSRDWLRRRRFPRGVLITTDRLSDSRPSPEHVGAFKRRALRALIDGVGLSIHRAYGNAATDICAYAEAGIPPARTFIVGKLAGQHCGGYPPTRKLDDYRHHRVPARRATR